MGIKIGMDLGTSTSEIAYLKNNEAHIIKNIQEGNTSIVPSVVFYEDNKFKVGKNAKKKITIKSQNVMEHIKLYMGQDIDIKIGEEKFKPEYISAVIAKRLKQIAEFNLNEEVSDVIVTVPAGFNSVQRKATRDALIIAGFRSIEIINEPTAAAIAYGINENANEKILVYDFGGGTFDVSILEIKNKTYKVLAVDGTKNLGGNDINKILYDTITALFEQSMDRTINIDDKHLVSTINEAIENVKTDLSFEEISSLIVPNIALDEDNNSLDLNLDLSRDDFEYLIDETIDKTLDIVDRAIKNSSLQNEEIDKIILVGGTTRIPLIRKKLNSKFNGKIVNGINPEEMVAKGAILSSLKDFNEIDILNEKISNNIGIEVIGGTFDPILLKNQSIPIEIEKQYKTVEDNQEIAEIKIYEGNSEKIKENKFIRQFDLSDIPKNSKGNENISLSFKFNLDGTLDIFSKVLSNNKIEKKQISMTGLSDNTIKELRDKLKNIDIFNGEKILNQNNNLEDISIINKEQEIKKIEEERQKEQEVKRVEEESQREQEVRRIEEERQREQEVRRIEEERQKEQEARRIEEERQKEQEARRIEEERQKEQEARRIEEERQREQEVRRIEEEKQREQEARKIEEENKNVKKLKLNFTNNQEGIIKNTVEKSIPLVVEGKNQAVEMKVENIINTEKVDTNEFVEEYDPARDSEIYDDIARLLEYYKNISDKLDNETKSRAIELIGDLTAAVKKDDFRKARNAENEIITLIYRG